MKAAVRRRLIPANPFAEVTCGSQVDDERIVYVPAEDIERVIATCPDNEWRLVFDLPRYAGARFPSEVKDFAHRLKIATPCRSVSVRPSAVRHHHRVSGGLTTEQRPPGTIDSLAEVPLTVLSFPRQGR